MATRNYFLETPAEEWSVKAAFQELERNNPSSEAHDNLQTLKRFIREAKDSDDNERVDMANKLLQDWKKIQKNLVPKRSTFTSNNNKGVMIVNSNNNTININQNLPAGSSGAAIDNNSSSGYQTWNTQEKQSKERKYSSTYLAGFYDDSNLGVNSEWIIDQVNVTSACKEYRQVTAESAQLRRYLSNSRILVLSYVFLVSATENCVITKMLPQDQRQVLKSIKAQN